MKEQVEGASQRQSHRLGAVLLFLRPFQSKARTQEYQGKHQDPLIPIQLQEGFGARAQLRHKRIHSFIHLLVHPFLLIY